MARIETGEPHADAGIPGGEDRVVRGLCIAHRGAAYYYRRDAWRRNHERGRRREADRNHSSRGDSLRKHGAASRAADAGECRSGNHQFDLSAHVVLLRAMDAAKYAATLDAEDCAGSADLPLCTAGAEHLRL